ncbi:uncharacterized protein LOC127843811 [Dreissena polymorpha]|uniref:uncharacterized protein LOC127843811 n=1 Tax=Dreissena polymorpha TaxID=45954 RepID=UPI0022647DCD|nr:uncharacterized protein LOC127843811 [Dreissena polymorpha]
MDDSTKDGSDSDWDSTLDFTSPRQVGIGQLRPQFEGEIEEESALSGESDIEEEQDMPNDKNVIRNVLNPVEDRPRAVTPTQKENNIILAQKQQNLKKKEQPANIASQQPKTEEDSPPHNFRDPGQTSPLAAQLSPPGKDRKGASYDPTPSPAPRGIPVNQGSIKSIGSWDDSDPDERTLKEIRSNYQQEKQREERLKAKEDNSIYDEPDTARSEGTWKSWKFGKKSKGKNGKQKGSAQNTPRGQPPPESARSQRLQVQGQPERIIQTEKPQQAERSPQVATRLQPAESSQIYAKAQPVERSRQVVQGDGSRLQVQSSPNVQYEPTLNPVLSSRQEVMSPSMIEVYDHKYINQPSVPEFSSLDMPSDTVPQFVDPERLFVQDKETGRQIYYFGHGNMRYYEVNTEEDEAKLPQIADRVDKVMQRLWQEVFSLLRILLSFFIWFAVELFRFLAKHIFQPLIVGIFVTLGDYVVKPFLSAVFNGFMQPTSIFCWNVFTGMRHMFNPIGEILRRIFEQMAMLFRSIRLFELTWVTERPTLRQATDRFVENV